MSEIDYLKESNYIIISPYSSHVINEDFYTNHNIPIRSTNPKNYPYWKEFCNYVYNDSKFSNYIIVQIGTSNENKISENTVFLKDLDFNVLKDLVTYCKFWLSNDNFFHHFVHYHFDFLQKIPKPGIVIYSKSDPRKFGYDSQINVLKSYKYLRHDQWHYWSKVTGVTFDLEAFPSSDVLYKIFKENFPNDKL